MHGAIRAAGFSLMTMFVSCGVGAQDLDARIAQAPPHLEKSKHWSAPQCDLSLPTSSQGPGYNLGKTNDITVVR
jgi:hypothetical protein